MEDMFSVLFTEFQICSLPVSHHGEFFFKNREFLKVIIDNASTRKRVRTNTPFKKKKKKWK